MAKTAAEVANIALLRIGHRQLLDSLEDETSESEACKALWADALDAVLSEVWWPFATLRSTLAPLVGVTRSGWEYAFALPAECLAVQSVYSGDRNPASDTRTRFALEYDAATGPILLCDEVAPEVSYTVRLTDVVRFPPLFVDALAWKLAADLARALAVKPAVAADMDRRYLVALARASSAAMNQRQADSPPNTDWIRARS